MARLKSSTILVFILGMVTFAIGSWFSSTFIFFQRPVKDGMIEDWDQICFMAPV